MNEVENITGKTELITVNEKDEVQTVSARELHKGLEISDRFYRWFESLLKYGFSENEDFWCVKKCTEKHQRNYI